jgi:ABC-type multidrug transport system fused ATPase/permease subunit
MIWWIPPEMQWLSRQVRGFVRWHVASFFCITVSSVLGLLAPLVLKWLIDEVLPSRRIGLLIGAVGLIFLCHQGRATLASVAGYLTMLAAQQLALDLRLQLLRHLDRLSVHYHEGTPVGASMHPLKEPVEEISYLGSELLPAILRALLATLLTLGTMLVLNTAMTLVVLPLIPVFLLTRKRFRNRLQHDSDTVQHNRMEWNSFLQQHLSSIVAVQLLRQEPRQERAAFRLLATTVRSHAKLFRTGVSFTFYTSLTVGLAMSAVIACGGWSVLTGSLTIGGLVAFYTYLTQLFDPLSGAAETYVRAQKTFASIRQVQAVLLLEPTLRSGPDAVPFPADRPWKVEMVAASFAYSVSSGTLSIPSLHIEAGESLAIVGANGAGKSTMAKLLARLYDVSSGAVVIAGRNVRNIEIESLRKHVCYLPPYAVLFDGTLAANLRFAKPSASEEELKDVLGLVGLAAGADSSEQGLKQRIGPGGSRLSGGQRQRLAIGRALLQQPRILILDEAVSCLDAPSEQQLLGRIRRALPGTTVIVISHRLSTLSCVEQVFVLEAGRLVENGAPKALLGRKGACWRLFHANRSALERVPGPKDLVSGAHLPHRI